MSLIFIISVVITFILFPVIYKVKESNNISIAFLPGAFKIPGIIILVVCVFVPSIYKVNEVPYLSELRYLFIIIGLVIICLSKEKDESKQYNEKRLIALFVSLIIVGFTYQVFLIFNFFDSREFSAALFPISVLMSYLFVFHLYKNRLRN